MRGGPGIKSHAARMGYMEPKEVPELPTRQGVISINTLQSVDKTFPKE